MLRKLLVICGPTATGKTKLAYKLANKLKGEIVSADSRQVYKEMDIGTGKGVYKNSKFKIKNSKLGVCYIISGTPLWGYDLSRPDEKFSVSQYFNLAKPIISDIWRRGKLPIIVGGSGSYIKALIDGFSTINVPPDEQLRKKLRSKSVDELFELLKYIDAGRAGKMNRLSRKNWRLTER
jgi:tRNA dimethylallyltransferase